MVLEKNIKTSGIDIDSYNINFDSSATKRTKIEVQIYE